MRLVLPLAAALVLLTACESKPTDSDDTTGAVNSASSTAIADSSSETATESDAAR